MKRIKETIVDLLRQGTSPEKLALTIAIGAALGVVPILGSSTLLCALAALAFRLNLPMIQLVNYVVYPIQIALVVPFLRGGSRLFGSTLPLASDQLIAMLRADPSVALESLGTSIAGAMILWIVSAAVLVLVTQSPIAWLLRRVRFDGERQGESPAS